MSVAGNHRLACRIALLLAAAGAPGRAAAAGTADISTQLDYAAAPGCPTAEAFASMVRGGLGYDPFRPDAPTRVMVRIDSAGRTIAGRVEWQDEDGRSIGEQTFPSRSGDCAELTRAIGFSLALQIQLMATTAAAAAAAPPTARPVTAPAGREPPPQTPEAPVVTAAERVPPPPKARPSILVGLGGAAGFGLAAGPVALGRLFAAAAWGRLAVELGGEVGLPATTNRADGAGFSQRELLLSLAACGAQGRWSACALAKLGDLQVTGQKLDVPLSASAFMAQAGLRLAASQPLGRRAFLLARAEGLVNLTRSTVTLDSLPVWAAPRLAATFGIDIGLKLP